MKALTQRQPQGSSDAEVERSPDGEATGSERELDVAGQREHEHLEKMVEEVAAVAHVQGRQEEHSSFPLAFFLVIDDRCALNTLTETRSGTTVAQPD